MQMMETETPFPETTKRDWKMAKAWLLNALT